MMGGQALDKERRKTAFDFLYKDEKEFGDLKYFRDKVKAASESSEARPRLFPKYSKTIAAGSGAVRAIFSADLYCVGRTGAAAREARRKRRE